MNTSAPQPPDNQRDLGQLGHDDAAVLPRVNSSPRGRSIRTSDRCEVMAAPRFYSVAQVAQIFGMSPMTVYRAIAAGEFPAVRIRGRLIVPARAVDAMAEVATTEHTLVDAAGWVTEVARR